MHNSIPSNSSLLSRLSLTLSSVCLLHCLAMPFIIVLLPTVSAFMNDTVETILILSILPVSLFAFIPTWLRHKDFKLISTFLLGLILIMVSHFAIGHHHDADSITTATHNAAFAGRIGIMILGVGLLAVATYRNNRHTHVCSNPHHHH